ncbi:MAG: TIGR03915 family putative DNA repair protein [Solirubrobacterales bacterium]
MPDRSDVVYAYDGSFEGLLCCIFESYARKEIPAEILAPDIPQSTLFPPKEIATDPRKAKRVLLSIPDKMGYDTLDFIRHAFLTCLPRKELYILLFMRLGYRHGRRVMDMLTDEVVHTLNQAVKHLRNESHLLKGFLRFSVYDRILVGEIGPKNYVLPLLTEHFTQRYPEENFIIFDRAHAMALVYQPYRSAIIPAYDLTLSEPDEDELYFRELWRLFYKVIEVEGRYNPRCRMSHMPKRYWKYMTEFGEAQKSRPALETPKGPGHPKALKPFCGE